MCELRRQDEVSLFGLRRGIIQSTSSCVVPWWLPCSLHRQEAEVSFLRSLGKENEGGCASRGQKGPEWEPRWGHPERHWCYWQVVIWRKGEPKGSSTEIISGDTIHSSNLYQNDATFFACDMGTCKSRLKTSAEFCFQMPVRGGGECDFLSFVIRKTLIFPTCILCGMCFVRCDWRWLCWKRMGCWWEQSR